MKNYFLRLVLHLAGTNGQERDVTKLGGLLTAQHDYKNGHAWEHLNMLIDNDPNTKYLIFKPKTYVQYQMGNPAVVTRYALTSANDAPNRDPKDWTLECSNDGQSWTLLDSRTNQDFTSRLQRREFSVSTSKSCKFFRLTVNNHKDDILQMAEWELYGTGGGGKADPSETWQEHWFEHNQLLRRVFFDDDVAIYHDPDVDPSTTWMNGFMGDVWRYTKRIYGDFGGDGRLHVVMHTGKYSGGHPSTAFDESHDYRNMIDCGPGPWITMNHGDLSIPTHEAGHIVELGSKGSHGSPAFGLWGDSKWMEIYIYDVYKGLGRDSDAQQWHDEKLQTVDNFPRDNTRWYRDWFWPIYSQYGGTQMLNRFFTLLSENFPKSGNGVDYSRGMNWGEFVHFWSGAANKNLKSQATTAFGWPSDWQQQFDQARKDFNRITYPD